MSVHQMCYLRSFFLKNGTWGRKGREGRGRRGGTVVDVEIASS